MSNQLMTKAFVAGAAIAAYTIVKFGADDNSVIPGAAAGDALIGVNDNAFDAALGERVDIVTHGIAEVKLGGTVARGGAITSNATGQGVAAAPATGVNNRIIGFALASGVSGDVIPVQLAPGSIQG